MSRRNRTTGDDPVVVAIEALGMAAQSKLDAPGSWDVDDASETWVQDPSNPGQWFAVTPSTRRLHPRVLFELEKTAEWTEVVDALKADPVLGRVIDQMVGDGMAATRLQSFGLVAQVLQAWSDHATSRFRVPRLLESWRSTFGSKDIEVSTHRLLFGLTVGRPLRLTPRMTLRRLSEAEVATALSVGAISPTPRFGSTVFLETPACLTYTERLPLRIGEPAHLDGAATYQQTLAVHEEASTAALRLLGFDQIRLGPSLRRLVAGGYSWSGATTVLHSGAQQAVGGRARQKLKSLTTETLIVLGSERAVAIALRRFSQSREGRHEQDQFLDLWIAMEALFGGESPNEVLFQLSINTANYIRIPTVDKRELFNWIKKVYDVRSKLVHGMRPSMRKQTRLDGSNANNLSDLSHDLQLIVRQALLMRLASRSDPDWIAMSLDT